MRFPALRQAFEPLVCSGSASERGLLQGMRFRKQTALSFNAYFHSETYQLLRRDFWPLSWSRSQACRAARKRLQAVLRRHYPEGYTQLAALAQGAEQSVNPFYYFLQLESYLSKVAPFLGNGFMLMIPRRYSALEEPMLLHSVDYPHFFHNNALVRQSEPEQGLRSLDITLSSSVGAQSGMNEAGLVIAYNHAYSGPVSPAGLPVSLLVQQALQSCHSADEALRFFEKAPYQGGAILGIMDSSEMYHVEFNGKNFESRSLQDQLLIATNHFQIPTLAQADISIHAMYTFKRYLNCLSGQRMRHATEARFDRLSQLTGTRIQFHPNDLTDYAVDHGGDASDASLCRHGEYYATACVSLLRPLARELRFAAGLPCEFNFQSYQWL